MTRPTPTPPWWGRAQAEGLLPADTLPPTTAPTPSWIVLLLSFAGAQLVLWPFLIFLAMLLGASLSSFSGALLTSMVLAAAALGLLRSSQALFAEQLGFSLLLAAQALWLWAFFLGARADEALGTVTASLLAFQCVLIWSVPQAWLRRLLGVLASWTFLFLPPWAAAQGTGLPYLGSVFSLWESWPRHTLLLAGAWAVWAHCEGRWLTRPWAAKVRDVLESAAVGLLLALALQIVLRYVVLGARGSADDPQAGQALLWAWHWHNALQAGAVLISAGWLLQRWPRRGVLWLVYAAALAACLGVPSMGVIAMLASFAAGTGRWRLLWLALAVALLELGNFYYALQWPLRDKAAALGILGVAMLLALWWLRSPRPPGQTVPAALRTPWPVALVLALTGAAALGLVQWDVQRKEAVLAHGQKIYLPLQPQDPRSLMQGDYMALRFALPAAVTAQIKTQQERQPLLSHVLVLARLDARGVADIQRLAQPGEVPQAGAVLLPLKLLKGRWVVVTDAFFFPEGQGTPLAAARFGEFRVLPDGRALLAGLAAADLAPVLPGARPMPQPQD
ncbi:Uncharacterised protein [uncultured Comamonas sp.]|nr:Uncharacterised protein [uncultured Comamonas sp.]